MKQRIKKTVAFFLMAVLVLGLFPATEPQTMKAATSSVSLANLGSLGSITAGSKTKSGKWWMMKVGSKKAFCMNLGYTCHTGDVYRNESATYNSGDSGKKGRKAYIGYWYAETMHESRKAYVMAQALFWAVEEGDTSETKLKAVISKVKSNTGYFSSKTTAELYEQIFEKSGTFSVNVTEWKYSGSGSHRQELLVIDAGNKVDPRCVSVDSFYRQRIRIRKVNEDGNPMTGAKFTIEAENIDELYSYNINGNASDAEEDISDFSIKTETDKDGWISLRLTYRLQTNDYFYLPDDDLATMDASAKKAVKDEWDDMGYHYASDLSEQGADQLLKRDMEKQITSIKNTYKIIETDSGNKNIVINPEYKDGKKIVIDLSNSWLREEWTAAGTWGTIGITRKEWSEVPESPYNLEITDHYKKVALSVKKRDSYSKDKKAHGDASLDGAEFGIYTDRQCTKKAVFYTESGRIYQGGNEFVTKNNGFETPYLRCGQSYYVKELRAPKGYKLKTDLSEITLDGGKYPNDVEYVPTKENLNVDEEPIRGKIGLRKFSSNGQTGQIHPEAGAIFQVYLRNKKGGYSACDDYERDTITIDEDGYACTKELYYGDYKIHQVSTGGVDTEKMQDFDAELKEPYLEKPLMFNAQDVLFKAYLRIIKKDGNTKKDVLKAGTTYQIYKVEDGKETLVTQEYSNGNKKVTVDKFVTDTSGQIMTYQALPSGTYRIYETDAATGYHIATPYIEAEINSKADNYKTETDKDGNTYSTVELEYVNQEAYGKLSLKKTGEQLTDFKDGKFIYEEKPLNGVIFEIHADEDIETQDGQGTHWFEKDSLVGTITTGKGAAFTSECGGITGYETDKDGVVTVKLPLGKYRITEKKTPYGYILPEKDWKVEFNWENKDTEAVLDSTGATDKNGTLNIKNQRAGTQIRLVKTDAQTKTGLEGAVFGIYTQNAVYNADGEKIAESGTLVGTATTDKEGNAVCSTDLPLMSEGYGQSGEEATSGAAVAEPEESTLNSGDYYLKEEAVSGSYYLDNKTEYPVHLEYKDQETKVVEAQVTAENTQTEAVISKTSLTNSEEIAGCSLQITDGEGNEILNWISGDKDSIQWNRELESMGYRNVSAVLDAKGAVQISGLLHDNTTYTLTETRPADGYTTADSISFRLVQGENGQTLATILDGEDTVPQKDNIIRMVDDVTKAEISKTDIAGSKEIPGCKLTITEKDSGKTVETWVSGKEPHRIDQKLTAGKTYVLTETRPADGYTTAESIEFMVRDTGEVQGIHMKDDTTKIRLIKTDNATGQGLSGAKFEVYDSRDKKVLSFISKEEGYDITGKLAAGETYTFKEVEAPEGYRLAKPVKYTVKDTGKVQKVTVKDDRIPKPSVPQTGGTTPTVFLGMAVAAFAAASAGVAVRRRKRKK